jgi:hypothetical protein
MGTGIGTPSAFTLGMNSKYANVTSIRVTHPTSDGGTVTFNAKIVKRETDGSVWVEIPARVRRMPFPPVGGKRFARFV